MLKKEEQRNSGKIRITGGQFVRNEKAQLAREFRREATAAEKKTWDTEGSD
jgi:hypothetical protein